MSTGFLYVKDGVVYKKNGNYEQAEVCFKRAIQNAEDKPDGYRELGSLYYDLGKYKEAIKLYDTYLEHRESSPFAYFGKAQCLHKLGLYKEESHCLSQLLLLTSSYPGYDVAYAKNLIATNDRRGARVALNDAILHNDKDIELRNLRARLLLEENEKELALEDLKQIMNVDYKEYTHYVKYSQLAIALEKYEEAEAALRQAIRLSDDAEDVVALYNSIPDKYKKK